MTVSTNELSPPSEVYTAGELAGLVLGSYKFSRGSTKAQTAILRWLSANYGDAMQPVNMEEVKAIVNDTALRYVSNFNAHPYKIDNDQRITTLDPNQVQYDLQLAFDNLDFMLRHRADFTDHTLKSDVSYHLTDADYTWHKSRSGRSGKYVTPIPYKSNVVHFGMLGAARYQDGHTTGRDEFDQMFKVAVDHVLSNRNVGSSYFKLEQLAKQYADEHEQARPAIAEQLGW